VANLVTVPLSSTGMATIYNSAGSTDVVVDAEGYYTSVPSANGTGLYNAISPVRALGALGFGAPVAANTSVPVQVTGTLTGVPANATAVVVNATAAHGTAASFLTVYPAGVTTVPAASNVNFSAGEAVANRATVAVGTGGQIEVYNHSGTVDVDVDVSGYYTGVGGTGSVFVPLATPVRITDTRGATPLNGTPIAANTSESFNLATTLSAIPTTATSVVSNFTVISGDASGYLSVYPTSTTVHPVSSSVNWTANETVPNFTIADTNSTGSVEVYNSAGGTINLLIDVFGYFTPSGLGPIMTSAVVTNTSIAITYNEAVVCPTLLGAQAEFVYDWTGAASGGAIAGVTCVGDVLTLTGVFTLPGSTGGSITYTAPAVNGAVSVSATSNGTYAGTQTLAVPFAAAPAMVSAYTTATTVVVTYNENVTCAVGVDAAFAYYYTGVATDAITGAACAGNVLTLTVAANDPPGSGASIVYTAPTTNTALLSVFATGSVPALYAATQAFVGPWTTPAMVSAVVTATTIAITYNGETLLCPNLAGAQADFAYYSAGTTSGITAVTAAACATDVLTLTGTFALPGTGASIVYTAPASPVAGTNAVSATLDFPQFAATQTLALTAAPVPAMVSAIVAGGLLSVAITYNENVTCPATGADGDFVYDSGFNTLGGAISGCSTAGMVLTLTGVFNAATGSASIVYTAPASSSVANAVYAAGSTGDFAATQTLLPL
jgi:hypothetical protein